MKHLIAGLFALFVVCIQIKANPTETDLSLVDRLALNVPSHACESIESLVSFGKANTKTDLEMTRFCFIWIAQNIKYDSSEYASKKRITEKQEPLAVFASHKALCRGYADLFTILCQKAAISARTVTGYCRNTEGVGIPDSLEFHAWNIIKIKDTWQLFDVTWASNQLDKSISIDTRLEQYFLQSAAPFIKRHLPFDPVCQLTDSIVSRNTFFFDNTNTIFRERSYFGNVDSILNEELHLDWTELNIRSYSRALTFMPEEKRLYDVLSYFKSEKANVYFNQAMKLLEVFNKLDEKTK
jgi:Transglutaminase-like superfamily